MTRLCVLAAVAYRRARAIARSRGAAEVADDIDDRLGQLYMLTGCVRFGGPDLWPVLIDPRTIERPWRQNILRLALAEARLARTSPIKRSSW